MKKLYFIFAALFLGFALANIHAQEMIVGGDMESADSWTIIDCTGNTETDFNHEFGYIGDWPAAGEDGCFHSYGSNPTESVNQLIYQPITLERGVPYLYNMAFKNTIDFNGFWFEVYLGEPAPVEGSDTYKENATGITLLGGWKYKAWVDACSNLNDGTLAEDGCLTPSGPGVVDDYIFYEGSGEIALYFGIKFGLGWTTGPYDYDILIDNVSITNGVGVEKVTAAQYNLLYPNPASDMIQLSNVNANEVQIFDVVGKKVYESSNVSSEMQINISDFPQGVYIMKLGDTTRKFMKE